VVALFSAACTPAPPTPNADYQMRDYTAHPAGPRDPVPCSATPSPVLVIFYPEGGGSVGRGVVEQVDGVSEHVLQFSTGVGLRLRPTTGEAGNDRYSIVVLFRLSGIGGYDRLIDVKHGTSESGLYLFQGGLTFWPHSALGSKTVANNEWAQVVLTRTAGGTVRGYVDGVQQWQFTDTLGDALIDSANELRFFKDNEGGTEHSAGAVARIRVFDRALSQSEIDALGQTPGSPCAT
jgi:hypothetical protein